MCSHRDNLIEHFNEYDLHLKILKHKKTHLISVLSLVTKTASLHGNLSVQNACLSLLY